MLRIMLRRLLQLAELRARVEAGDSVDSVMAGPGKAVFYKEKPAVAGQVARFGAGQIARFVERVAAAERSIKHGDPAGDVITQDLVLAIGRAAARVR